MNGGYLHLSSVPVRESTADMIARLTRQVVADMAEHAGIGLQAAHVWLEGLGNGYDLRHDQPEYPEASS